MPCAGRAARRASRNIIQVARHHPLRSRSTDRKVENSFGHGLDGKQHGIIRIVQLGVGNRRAAGLCFFWGLPLGIPSFPKSHSKNIHHGAVHGPSGIPSRSVLFSVQSVSKAVPTLPDPERCDGRSAVANPLRITHTNARRPHFWNGAQTGLNGHERTAPLVPVPTSLCQYLDCTLCPASRPAELQTITAA